MTYENSTENEPKPFKPHVEWYGRRALHEVVEPVAGVESPVETEDEKPKYTKPEYDEFRL